MEAMHQEVSRTNGTLLTMWDEIQQLTGMLNQYRVRITQVGSRGHGCSANLQELIPMFLDYSCRVGKEKTDVCC